MATAKEIHAALKHLAGGFPYYALNRATIDAYQEDLRDTDGKLLMIAARELRREGDRFPVIARIRRRVAKLAAQAYQERQATAQSKEIEEIAAMPPHNEEDRKRVRTLIDGLKGKMEWPGEPGE